MYGLAIRLYAPFNEKAANWIAGRKNWRRKLQRLQTKNQKRIWFHISSLGEFEQAKPVILLLRNEYDVVISFYSPSGYEIAKQKHADLTMCYLPLDTKKNAKDFIELLQPAIGVFVKYDLWPNFLRESNRQKIPLILMAAHYPKGHKSRGWLKSYYLKRLSSFTHISVQTAESKDLLNNLRATISVDGDPRIDAVLQDAKNTNLPPLIKQFSEGSDVLVAGSSYQQEEKILKNLIDEGHWTGKIIVAPHVISADHMNDLRQLYREDALFWSEWKNNEELFSNQQILIIDSIGMLKMIYSVAHIALVGGGFGKTVHNTLEPAVFGLPIFFGPNYHQFNEAVEMVREGGAKSFHTTNDMAIAINQKELLAKMGVITAGFINRQSGAAKRIALLIEKSTQLTVKDESFNG